MNTPARPTPQDRHDLDKLAKWREGLSGESGLFPVYAIFLITEADQDAYNIFRQYRSAFEGAGAPFHHLVIFGQHGASTASRALARELGLAETDVPVLALVDSGSGADVTTFALPKGESGQPLDEAQPWNQALLRITGTENTRVENTRSGLDLDVAKGVARGPVPGGSVASLARRISEILGN